MRRILIRAGIVLAAFVIALALVEMGMRVWARVEGMRMAEELTGNDPLHRPIVVFCGDSNIYGVYVKPDETLPAVVERLCASRRAMGSAASILGFPGEPPGTRSTRFSGPSSCIRPQSWLPAESTITRSSRSTKVGESSRGSGSSRRSAGCCSITNYRAPSARRLSSSSAPTARRSRDPTNCSTTATAS